MRAEHLCFVVSGTKHLLDVEDFGAGRDGGCGCNGQMAPLRMPPHPLTPTVSQQHDLVRAARTGMALQDAASGGNNLAGGKRDEAKPQPDRDGQGDLGRWCGRGAGALCVCAWRGNVPHWCTPWVEGSP